MVALLIWTGWATVKELVVRRMFPAPVPTVRPVMTGMSAESVTVALTAVPMATAVPLRMPGVEPFASAKVSVLPLTVAAGSPA
jgi:hypothetical protein